MKATVSAGLLQQWTSVAEDFARLSMGVTQAAKELHDPGAPPSAIFVEALITARKQFADFSGKVYSLAQTMAVSPLPAADTLVSLYELRTLLDMIAEAEGKAIAEDLRARGLAVLDRVLALIHRDQIEFAPLLECQTKARTLHLAVAEAGWRELPPDAETLAEGKHLFSDLLMLVERQDDLDDEMWGLLQDTVTQAFGRPLAVAASRGKLITPGATVAIPPTASVAGRAVVLPPPLSNGPVEEPSHAPAVTSSVTSGARTPTSETVPSPSQEPVTVAEGAPQREAAVPSASQPRVDERDPMPEPGPARFEPDNTAQKVAAALLNGRGADRSGLLRDLMWRLLYEDKLSLAFHLAQSAETRFPDGQLRLPSWLIQAATLSRHIRHADGEIAQLLKEGFDQFHDADVTTGNDEWNHAVKLLAVAAALQPALSAPQAGTATVLRTVRLDDNLTQLSAYCRVIAEYAEKNQPLDPAVFKKGKGGQATWQAEIDALKQAAESWWTRASRMTMVYPPATRVWAKWLEPKGLLTGLLAPVRNNDGNRLQLAKRSIEQLSDDAQVKREVDRTDREVLGRLLGDDIPTKALDQIRLHLREAVGFVRRWVELQESRGRGKDAAQEQAEQLRQMVWSYQEVVLEEVNFFKRRHPSLWVAAGVACCRRALEQVRTLFDPQITFPTEEPLPRPLLYADLLRIPSLPLNDQWEPEVTDRTIIIDGILELLAGKSAKKVMAEA